MIMNSVIFREYDVRGIYNKDFDNDFAYHLGKSYYAYASQKLNKKNLRLSLGHDARTCWPFD